MTTPGSFYAQEPSSTSESVGGKTNAPSSSEDRIRTACDEIKELLVDKNRKYGNSALEPVRVFSRASPQEQLLVRLDDKLSRIARGDVTLEDEDVLLDLIGYLVLLKVARWG